MLAYGSLAFPLAAAFIALQVFVPTFYADAIGLSLAATGYVLLLARLWDMITDPIVGYVSDHTPAHWGRRRLWVLVAAPFVVLAVWKLFNPPSDATTGYLALWSFVIYAAGTLAIVPLNAWGAELTPDYQERGKVTGIRAAFGLAGTLSALALAAIAVTNGQTELAPVLENVSWLVTGTLVLSLAAAVFWVPDRSVVTPPKNSFLSALSLLRGYSPFRQLLIAFLLNGIGNAIPATLFLLYVTHVLAAPDLAGPLLFGYFCCAVLSIPFWLWLAKRFGKHQTWMAGVLLAACAFIWTPLLGPDSVHWFIAIVIITGFATSSDLILPTAVMADLIEWDALENGYQRPGIFFALWGTVSKLAFGLAIGIAFPLLDFAGFDTGGDNDASEIAALAFLYGAPCIVFKLAAVLCMRNYPITQAVHQEIRQKLGSASGI